MFYNVTLFQEDKIKRLATKLIRVVTEKKRLEMSSGGVPARHRDIETEELIEDQQHKIRELERQSTQLKEKLLVARQQIIGPGGQVPQSKGAAAGGGAHLHQKPHRKAHSRYRVHISAQQLLTGAFILAPRRK